MQTGWVKDDIKVEQWDKNEVSINVSVYLDNGEGNEAFNLKTERNGDQVKIYSDFGDYYKKGKAINIELSKTRLAQKLGMKFAIKLDNNELIIKYMWIELGCSI